jgi:two-component system, chemotaxis family, sensor kinase CheA
LVYGVDSVAQLAHALEGRLAENGKLDADDLGPLLARWGEVATKVRELVGSEQTSIEVDDADYWRMFAAIERRAPHSQLREQLLSWRLEPTQVRLHRIAEQAQALASRLGKGPISVGIEANELRLAREQWSPFWAAAVHVIRNAVDHGLESPEERHERGKSDGSLVLRTEVRAEKFVIELSDDGRGIDWDAVQRKAETMGVPTQTHAEREGALFVDGLSTKEAVTELSGRGVGLGAVRRACEELGGKMELSSSPGHGTTVRFLWPVDVLRASASRVSRPSRPPPPRPDLDWSRTG